MAQESGNEAQGDWMVANIPPPEAFDSGGGISGGKIEASAIHEGDHENSAAVNDDQTEEESTGNEQGDIGGSDDASKQSPKTKIEIIGQINSDTNNLEQSTLRELPVTLPNQKKLSRSGIRRSKPRRSGNADSKDKAVETLAHSEEDHDGEEKMKIDIKDRGILDEDDVPEPVEDVDYVSDDTASSVSSLGEEAIHDWENTSWHCETMNRLCEPDFDVWRLGRDAMVDHLEYMYHDLGVTRAWRIPRATLRMFLLGVRERYQDNPYHNFKHCFSVTQMTYSMVCKLKLRHLLSVDDLGMMLTAAVCHDVDHPGLNNGYHAHAHSPLAILYNYKSILEQHHFAVTCRILTNKERNIFQNVPNRDEILNGTRELILATDLALHKDIMEEYRRHSKDFDFKNKSHVLSLLKIIIKCADVSNEVRPENIATPWVECLFSEYYEQSAREKRERLPVTPYMDPEKVDVTDSQEGFIRGMMLPMYNELSNLIVDARIYYVNPLKQALLRYEIQKRQRM